MDFKSLLPTKEDHVGKGLASALQCFRENGSLKESRGEWIGRSRDKRTPENGKFEFNLDHRDEHGQTLTPKEAFRQFSHKFHHVKPGKRKQEKKLKKQEQELKKRKKEEHPLEFMERLRGIQVKSGTAYIRT
ncbi:SART-1 family protein DOT2 [Selaginella moellendorffii]|nr:SART-1 family protein DOT2 [Selaginella moellendorffii]|eukprot:XP_024532030.1 SART-1 family protein DOT2 [Selaginella moellendorffii]